MTRLFALLICLPLLLPACVTPFPESDRARLAEVQAAYDREFQVALRQKGAFSSASSFPDTLQLISGTRGNSDDPRLKAYLDVLEGMIHLQTNQTGKAAAMRADVANAASVLKGDAGRYPRDVLFARSFESLLQGREAMAALDGVAGHGDAAQERRLSLSETLIGAARQITQALCADRRAGRLANPADDAGATMLAGFGASYLATADVGAQKVCTFEPPDEPLCAAYLANRAQLIEARNLRASFAGAATGRQLDRLDQEIAIRLTQANPTGSLPPPADICA